MNILILIGLAAVLFIAGVLLIAKATSSEDVVAVPISNPEEIKELKSAFISPNKVDVAPEEADEKVETEEGGLVDEQKNLGQEENEQLNGKLQEQKDKYNQLKKDLDALTKEYGEMQDQQAEETKALKGQIDILQKEKDGRDTDPELIEKLKAKSILLEKQYEEGQVQQAQQEQIITELKTEKDRLTEEVEKREGQVVELQAELKEVQETSQTKLKDAQEMIERLKMQKPEVDRSDLEGLGNKVSASISALESLKKEYNDLQQVNLDLKNSFKTTEELNAHLVAKEKMMQYELTKSRAQALGLEKICEDFKVQIEVMTAASTADV